MSGAIRDARGCEGEPFIFPGRGDREGLLRDRKQLQPPDDTLPIMSRWWLFASAAPCDRASSGFQFPDSPVVIINRLNEVTRDRYSFSYPSGSQVQARCAFEAGSGRNGLRFNMERRLGGCNYRAETFLPCTNGFIKYCANRLRTVVNAEPVS